MADPARAKGATRKEMQDACRQEPCRNARRGQPGCVICVHEGRIAKGEKP